VGMFQLTGPLPFGDLGIAEAVQAAQVLLHYSVPLFDNCEAVATAQPDHCLLAF
jgi:hypothetical protein